MASAKPIARCQATRSRKLPMAIRTPPDLRTSDPPSSDIRPPTRSVALESVLLRVVGVERNLGDLFPQRIRDRGREVADRLGDALWPAHADDRGRHAWVASRELQGDSRQRNAVPLSNGREATHA